MRPPCCTGTDSPFTYQWFFKRYDLSEFVEIVGATSATYTIIEGDVNDFGDYLVTVTNACGADSSQALVTGPL